MRDYEFRMCTKNDNQKLLYSSLSENCHKTVLYVLKLPSHKTVSNTHSLSQNRFFINVKTKSKPGSFSRIWIFDGLFTKQYNPNK